MDEGLGLGDWKGELGLFEIVANFDPEAEVEVAVAAAGVKEGDVEEGRALEISLTSLETWSPGSRE